MFNYSIIFFLLLFVISEIVRKHYFKKLNYPTVSAGSVVMAIGIFSLAAQQTLPIKNIFLSELIALGLLILWLYIAISYCICFCKKHLLIQGSINQFSIGTWVAGCAMMAMVIHKEFPSLHILIWIMVLIAIAIWLVYLLLVIKLFWRILIGVSKSHTGIILLSTVSTQSIVIVLNTIIPNHIPQYVNQVLIIIGFVFYVIGLIIILRYYIPKKTSYILIWWSNTNSIIHGALSITGIASLITHVISNNIIILTWVLTTGLFFLIESASLIKLYQRVKIAGLLKGALSYNISQWSRVFTYGMYYAFSLLLFESKLFQNQLLKLITQDGQYIVLITLLIEILIFFRSKFSN